MRKPHKKPTGLDGIIRASSDKGAELERLVYPGTKEANEKFVVDRFFTAPTSSLPFEITGCDQNDLDDLDFTIQTSAGEKYLELMEIAPLEKSKGSYEGASETYQVGEHARFIFDKMMGKSDKYSVPAEKKIVLLVYSTHFGFNLSESVLALLQYWCVRERHKFERILLFAPDPKIVQTIFPLKLGRLLEVLDAEQYADNKVLNLHPKKWKNGAGEKVVGKDR